MTPRSIRRAAERKAVKKARKAAHQLSAAAPQAAASTFSDTPLESPEPEFVEAGISSAQFAANRANAQLSTGPKSPEGKASSCLNAVKTALTGRTVLLPTDDAADYEDHVQGYQKELRPLGPRESTLVQSLADTDWRLTRIAGLEMSIFAQGRLQFAGEFHDRDASLRPGLTDLRTLLVYEKQLRNLQLQEARLHRRREKDTAALRTLQKEREHREAEQLELAAKFYLAAQHDHKPFDPEENGFDCSTEDIEAYLEAVRASQIARATFSKERAAASASAKASRQAA